MVLIYISPHVLDLLIKRSTDNFLYWLQLQMYSLILSGIGLLMEEHRGVLVAILGVTLQEATELPGHLRTALDPPEQVSPGEGRKHGATGQEGWRMGLVQRWGCSLLTPLLSSGCNRTPSVQPMLCASVSPISLALTQEHQSVSQCRGWEGGGVGSRRKQEAEALLGCWQIPLDQPEQVRQWKGMLLMQSTPFVHQLSSHYGFHH